MFVTVASIKDNRITGRIASDIIGVKGFKNGDPYTFSESELADWLITHPDGSEEGMSWANSCTNGRRRARASEAGLRGAMLARLCEAGLNVARGI